MFPLNHAGMWGSVFGGSDTLVCMSDFEPVRRFQDAPFPEIRLVSPQHQEAGMPCEDAVRIVQAGGRWRVTGPAGSGVSSVVVDAVVECLRQGQDPRGIVVLTHLNQTATRLRKRLVNKVAAQDFVSDHSIVRSVQSLAFSVIQQAASSSQPPRLVSGADQDGMIRALLLAQQEQGGVMWPPEQRAALGFVGFARGLRDFLVRALERGLGPEDLVALGQQYERPLWAAAGEFLREYKRTAEASGIKGLSASELVPTALDVLECHPDVLARLGSRLHTVIVDDAQHFDPRTAQFLTKVMASARLVVVAGDAEQSVLYSRGARPDFLLNTPVDHELELPAPATQPNTRVIVAEHPSGQISLIADVLRRAHLLEQVAWRDMAVVVRSSGQLATVRRGLLAAGVPVHMDPTDLVLSEQRIVTALLLAMQALQRELSHDELEELALGPVGGADPVTLRRLLRGLRQAELAAGGVRRALDVLADAVSPRFQESELLAHLSERELGVVERLRSVLAAGFAVRTEAVDQVLWALWEASGLADRLMARSLRGGPGGSQADRDLDAIMTLFDVASDYVEQFPQRSTEDFLQHIQEQQLPGSVRSRRGGDSDAINLVTAHATGGQHWHTVCVAGVQEGVWPSLGEIGTLFGEEELVDLLDEQIDPNHPVSKAVDRLREEQRLFYLACSRATKQLVVSAVESPDSHEVLEPSRFLETCGVPIEYLSGQDSDSQRLGLLSESSLIAELRRVVCDPQQPGARRQQAASQLARLADAGFYGARPEEWWGARPATEQTMRAEGPIRLSPSRIEAIEQCPLKAVLGNLETDEDTPIHMLRGTLVHAFAEAVARGVSAEEAEEIVTQAYEQLLQEPSWKLQSTMDEWRRLLQRTNLWLKTSRSVFTEVGVEMPLDVPVGATEDGQEVRIRGRMDRLERDGESLVVVDLKTGKTMPAEKNMGEHAQLAAYQLGLSRGVVDMRQYRVRGARDGEVPAPVGGGVLVFPAPEQKNVPTRTQAPLGEEELNALAERLPELAMHIRGPALAARINDTCTHCNLRSICPVQPEGRMTTHV